MHEKRRARAAERSKLARAPEVARVRPAWRARPRIHWIVEDAAVHPWPLPALALALLAGCAREVDASSSYEPVVESAIDELEAELPESLPVVPPAPGVFSDAAIGGASPAAGR